MIKSIKLYQTLTENLMDEELGEVNLNADAEVPSIETSELHALVCSFLQMLAFQSVDSPTQV